MRCDANERRRRRMPVFFYCADAGNEPVREWLKEFDPEDRQAVEPISHACRPHRHEGDGAMTAKKSKHWGSTLDDLLKEEGSYEEAKAQVGKEMIAWQIQQAMKRKGLTKKRMAELMETSRTQVDRLLNPKDHNVTLATLEKAAAVVGRQLRLELA